MVDCKKRKNIRGEVNELKGAGPGVAGVLQSPSGLRTFGFCGSSEEVARANSDNATLPICDPDCVDTTNSIDNGDPAVDPELNSEHLHGPGNGNDIDTDSILPVLDYESEGSAGSVSSGSVTPAMVGMAGNTNETMGVGNDIDPLSTPITPDNTVE